MRYIVYIDRLFLLHGVQTLALLLLTGMVMERQGHRRTGTGRVLAGAAAETFFFCLVFLLPGIGGLVKNLLFALCQLLVLTAVFGIRTRSLFVRAVILYHGAAFFLGGLLYAFLGLTGRSSAAHTLPAAACAAAMAGLTAWLWQWEESRREKILVTAELIQGNVRIVTTALIDSGNSLYDPISARPVSVVERSVLQGRISLNRPEKFRLVPYHTIGKRGLMQAVEIDTLKVNRDGAQIVVERPLLGLYEGELSGNGACRMILHPGILRAERGKRKRFF